MIKHFILIFLSGAGLLACSSVQKVSVHSEPIPVIAENFDKPNFIDSLILPYSDSLDAEMNVVIATLDQSMEKNRPNGLLNNWSADALLNAFALDVTDAPLMSLLNVGGLRNTLNEGDITIGDIFKVMPFDNEVVLVKMPLSSLGLIGDYLKKSGGEPISGAEYSKGELKLVNEATTDFYYILTSDYLLNGGDKMDFFQEKIEFKYVGYLLRDVFIQQAKLQKNLIIKNDNRIQF